MHELHSKDGNKIYNLFTKAISRLSKEFSNLELQEFENISKHLLEYISKDRQTETILDKLCLKMKNSPNPIEWRNTAFCLSQIKYSEKLFQRLFDHFELYKDKVFQSPEVKVYLLQIIPQVKKFTKPESKSLVEEFEAKLNMNHLTAQN